MLVNNLKNKNLSDAIYNEEIVEFDSSSGDKIFSKHLIPKRSRLIRYHFYIVHGAIEYHDRLNPLIEYLKKVYRDQAIISYYDHVGHGFSTGHRAHVDNFQTYTNDFLNFFSQACEKSNQFSCKKIVIAHSMGGLISLLSLVLENQNLKYKPDAVILSNPCIRPNMDIPRLSISLIQKFPDLLMKTRIPVIHGGVGLTTDEDRARLFQLDPLISKSMSLNMGLEVLNASKKLRSLGYYINFPCYFLLSGDDRVCDVEMTRLFISGIEKNLVDMVYYPRARHELFNEVNRDEVFGQISDWILKRL
jgi:alpha-beta hydrolase superfamily lysophospholipase